MKLTRLWIRLAVAILIAFSVLGLSTAASLPGEYDDPGPGILTLKAPAFLSVANAQVGQQSLGSFLDSEAGIAAYFQAASPIDLSLAQAAFRTIETQTVDYIIGSVPIKDYPVLHDAHVYVHKNGWILAYYLKADPESEIFDWIHFSGSVPTKLELAMGQVAAQAGVAVPPATFYDFRYPNANSLMLITQNQVGSNFQVNLPSSFTYSERSWTLATYSGSSGCYGNASLSLNGTSIDAVNAVCAWTIHTGTLTQAQMTLNAYHTFSMVCNAPICYSGLALAFQVP